MKYVDEFRNKKLIEATAQAIGKAAACRNAYSIMEVCGTHTTSVFRFGLRSMLPDNIRLISGPGCPVCVTPNDFLDKAICIAGERDVIIATFGDMLKVPGSRSSLEKERAKGRAVKVVYSTTDALEFARNNRSKEIVFLGVGFETTIPTVAASMITAKKDGIDNYSVLCGHKTMPAALAALAKDRAIAVDGFMLPGHVSAIIGARPYRFLADIYEKNCVISGFEPLDIMRSILMLITQKRPEVGIEYSRVIRDGGNILARKAIYKVFEKVSSKWRGIGSIKDSGLAIRKEFSRFDAELKFKPKIAKPLENKACLCGDVLKGMKTPLECKLFGKTCRPEKPVGSCMVSSEGTCAAYYRYTWKK